jgi:predicted ATPase
LRLSWLPKVTSGFFLRAESFFNFASYIDSIGGQQAYGGQSLHTRSHGESFLTLFTNRFTNGIYLLDEPEAALSPARQLAFLKIINDRERSGRAQFIIATHSPILLSYPGAAIYSLDGPSIDQISAADTEHVRLTRDFLNAPERYLGRLLEPEEE